MSRWEVKATNQMQQGRGGGKPQNDEDYPLTVHQPLPLEEWRSYSSQLETENFVHWRCCASPMRREGDRAYVEEQHPLHAVEVLLHVVEAWLHMVEV